MSNVMEVSNIINDVPEVNSFMNNVLEINNLVKNYDSFSLKDVSFSVPEGINYGFYRTKRCGENYNHKIYPQYDNTKRRKYKPIWHG